MQGYGKTVIVYPVLFYICCDIRVRYTFSPIAKLSRGSWSHWFLGRYDIFRLCYFPCDYYASFIGTIVLFMVPLCDDFITLLLVNVLIGIGAAISMPVATDIAVVIGRKVGIGSGMGIFNTTISIGIIIAPLMSGVVMDHAGINSVFYFI